MLDKMHWPVTFFYNLVKIYAEKIGIHLMKNRTIEWCFSEALKNEKNNPQYHTYTF